MNKKLEFFRLEDRILFEAAAAAEVVETMENDAPNANQNETDRQAQEEKNAVKNAPPENPAEQIQPEKNYLPDPADLSELPDLSGIPGIETVPDPAIDSLVDSLLAPQAPDGDVLHLALNNNGETISTGKELVIINSSVMDADSIISELAPNQEVLRLEQGSDAMRQILDYLNSSDTVYDAIHIVSHGNAGYFVLNGEVVSTENFDAAQWSAIGEHMTDDGDILLYGCNLAENEAGRDLVSMIADASGADVAASTNVTGISGDWTLEYNHGLIETASISVDAYDYRLNNILVTVDADSGAGSLRQAVIDASSGDEITFAAGVNDISLTTGDIAIDKNLTISGNVDAATGDAMTHITAAANSRVFTISEGVTVELDNLILTGNGTVSGNGGVIRTGSNAQLILDNSTVQGGHTAANGGGIYSDLFSTVTLTDSTVAGNTADGSGGGIYGNGVITLTNSTVSGNLAKGDGGGIYGYGSITLANCTVAGNSAKGDGGGIYGDASSTITLLNCIVAGNYGDAVVVISDIYTNGSFTAAYSIYHSNAASSNSTGNQTGLYNTERIFGSGVIWSASLSANGLHYLIFGNNTPVFDGTVYRITDTAENTNGTIIGSYEKDGSTQYAYRQGSAWYDAFGNSVTAAVTPILFDQLGNGRNPSMAAVGAYQVEIARVIGWYGNADVLYAAGYIATLEAGAARGGDIYLYGMTITVSAEVTINNDTNFIGMTDVDGRALTAITVGGAGNFRIFNINSGVTVELNNLILTGKGTVSGSGGVIYVGSSARLILDHSTVQGGHAAQDGGGIYASASSAVTVSNSTVADNETSGSGGGIFTAGRFILRNSTLHNNRATGLGGVYGGGIYGAVGSDISIADSTIAGNWVYYNYSGVAMTGGGIYSDGALTVLNSIMVGNFSDIANLGSPSHADDIAAYGTLNMAYSIFGTGYTPGTADTNTRSDIASVFNGHWESVNGEWLIADSANNPVFDGIVMAISADGAAAHRGTLVGAIGSTLYFRHNDGTSGDGWYYFNNGSIAYSGKVFTTNAADNFGLGTSAGTTMFTGAQNGTDPDLRVKTHLAYNAGAYALNTVVKTANLVVGTEIDWINPFSTRTSLREALNYAGHTSDYNWDSNGNGVNNGFRITFDSTVFGSADTVIVLTMGELVYGNTLAPLWIDAGNTFNLTVKVPVTYVEDSASASSWRVFNLAGGTDVTITGMILSGGDISGNGGVIFAGNGSRVTLDTVTVSGARALSGGGIYTSGSMTILNSTVSGNTAENGGGIYTSDSMTILNSTISGNTANYGGGIYGETVNILNSIAAGNYQGSDPAATGAANDIYASTLNMKYSVYGSVSGGSPDATNVQSDIAGIFNGEWALDAVSGKWFIADRDSGAPVFDGKVMWISATGPAAYSGTLTARDKTTGEYYYRNMTDNRWYKLGDDQLTRWSFSNTAPNYGLNNDFDVYTAAGNSDADGNPVSRVQTPLAYNAGAYALNVYSKNYHVVTLTEDRMNPFIAGVTLREALGYASFTTDYNWDPDGGTNYTGFEITFDAAVFGSGNTTIVLTLGELVYQNQNVPLLINGSNALNLTVKVPVTYAESVENSTTASNWRVLNINSYADITIRDLTMSGGDISVNGNYLAGYGGAIYTPHYGSVTLENVTVTGSKAYYGGGILGGMVTLENSQVLDCVAMGSGGGITGQRGVSVTNSLLSGNSTLERFGGGGAISSEVVTVKDSVLSDNRTANSGGAINSLRVTVINSTLSNNHADNWGGAIYSFNNKSTGDASAPIVILNSTISGNTAIKGGGAIYGENLGMTASTTVSLTNSTISGNTTNGAGGGIFLKSESTGGTAMNTMNLLNSIVLGNYSGSGTVADDIYFLNDGTLNAAYSVYGKVTGSYTPGNDTANVTDAAVEEIFANVVDGKPVLENGTLAIRTDGRAAHLGAMIYQGDDGKYYYRDGLNFIDVEGNSGGPQSYTAQAVAQNGVRRDQTTLAYNIGAYALDGVYAKGLVVSTETDWINPFSSRVSLREAMSFADANNGGTVTFDSAVFGSGNTVIVLTLGELVYSNAGALVIDASNALNLTIKVPVTYAESVANSTTASNWRVFNFGANTDVSVRNMTVKGGDISGDSTQYGGAILGGADSRITLDSVTASESKAHNGGGIYTAGSMTILNSTVSDNEAVLNGGGICTIGQNLSITNSTVSGNTATGRGGGGVFCFNGTLSVADSVISGNRAGDGGNTTGGGIYFSGENLNMTNSTVSGNSANYSGGGIYSINGNLSVTNSTLSGNSAGQLGGGIYKSSGSLSVTNSTLSGNRSGDWGGGGAIYIINGSLSITNSTLSGNTVGNGGGGGGIYSAGNSKVNVLNSIVLGNYRGSGDYWYSDDISGYGTLNMGYSVYGKTGLSISDNAENIQSDIDTVFGAEWKNVGGSYALVHKGTQTPILQNGVMPILATGLTAYCGTLTAVDAAGNSYYRNMSDNYWYMLGDSNTAYGQFDSGALNYGLTANAVVQAAAQNLDADGNPVSRVQTDLAYNIGAYAYSVAVKDSVVSTSADWLLNPFTAQSSLRELVNAAADGDTIRYADGFNVLTLTLGEIAISVNLNFADGFNISGGDASGNIFTVADGKTATFGNVTLNTGRLTGNIIFSVSTAGDAVYDGGDGIYEGTADGVIYAGSYDSLTLTGSGVKTFNGALAIAGNLVIAGSGSNDYLQVDGNSAEVNLTGSLTASYADFTGMVFTGLQTINSYDAAAQTNTVSGSGNTNLTIILTADTVVGSDLVYGQTLNESSLSAFYTIRRNAMAPESLTLASGDRLLNVARDPITGEAVSQTITGVTFSGSDYVWDNTVLAIKILPCAITVTADSQSKTYGDSDPALTWEITEGNLVGSDSLSGELARDAGEDAGVYAIKQGSLDNSNYDITFVNGSLTISQRAITVTADNQSKTYGDSDPALTWEITEGNLVGDDSLSGKLTREAGEKIGVYAIKQGSLDNSNYNITFIEGYLTICSDNNDGTIYSSGLYHDFSSTLQAMEVTQELSLLNDNYLYGGMNSVFVQQSAARSYIEYLGRIGTGINWVGRAELQEMRPHTPDGNLSSGRSHHFDGDDIRLHVNGDIFRETDIGHDLSDSDYRFKFDGAALPPLRFGRDLPTAETRDDSGFDAELKALNSNLDRAILSKIPAFRDSFDHALDALLKAI